MMSFDWFFFRRLVPALFSRPLMQPINQLLFRVAISGMGLNNWDEGMRDERRMLHRLASRLGPHPVILDVGANHGQFAALVREAVPTARILSFEPNPAAFAKLVAAADRLKIEPFNVGCGNQAGRFTLFDSTSTEGSGLATFVPGVFERQGVEPVGIEAEVVTLDQFCADHRIEQVALLKIDVEGFERSVLEGATRMIAEQRIDAVQLEFNEMNLDSHTTIEDIQGLLAAFALHRVLYDGNLLSLDTAPPVRRNLFVYQNLVALRRPAPTQL